MNLEFHPVANIFPQMTQEQFEALVADIDQHGQREPIVVLDQKILDGRHRYSACVRLGRRPIVKEYDGDPDDVVGFVVSHNLHRRHLNESQRAMVAAEISNMRAGARTDLEPLANLPEVSREQAAQMLSVSPRTVTDARTVLTDPEIAEQVRQGKKKVWPAAQEVRAKQRANGAAKPRRKPAAPAPDTQRFQTICNANRKVLELRVSQLDSLARALHEPGVINLEVVKQGSTAEELKAWVRRLQSAATTIRKYAQEIEK